LDDADRTVTLEICKDQREGIVLKTIEKVQCIGNFADLKWESLSGSQNVIHDRFFNVIAGSNANPCRTLCDLTRYIVPGGNRSLVDVIIAEQQKAVPIYGCSRRKTDAFDRFDIDR